MIKNKLKIMKNVLAFLLAILLTFSANNAFAVSVVLEINVTEDAEIRSILASSEKARTYKYWDLSKKYSPSDDKVKLSNELYNKSDAELDKMFTSNQAVGQFKDGKITLSGIKDGFYYFRSIVETKTSKYISSFVAELSSAKSEKIEIFNKNTIIPIESGKVRLIKSDQHANKLANVGFRLYEIKAGKELSVPLIAGYQYSEQGKKDLTLYTDKNGEINVGNLPFGKYIFREVEALPGYIISSQTVDFSINSTALVELNVENIKPEIGRYEFLKIADNKEQTRLSGAKFEIYRLINGTYEPFIQNGSKVVLVSGKDGKFSLENAPYGKYQIKEIEAPYGYVLGANPIDFEVDEESSQKVLIIKNKPEIPGIPPEQPETGDRGILIYLILGSIAVASLAVLYVVKKKSK